MNAPAQINAASSRDTSYAAVARPFAIAVLVLPGFSNLALHAYLEPFRIANAVSRSPLFRWQIVGTKRLPVEGANGLSVAVDMSIDDLALGIDDRERIQVAIVAGEPVERQLTPQLAGFLRTVARRGVPISAVGTATWLLARAGLLADTRCTIHWSRLAAFSEVFHKPRIRDALFVKDGQFSTCAGELAAFDLAVEFIGCHAGDFIAQEVCRHATVDGQRSGSSRQTGPSGVAFARVSENLLIATQIMEDNIEFPLSMDQIAQRVGISRRQLERLFASHIGLAPAQYYLRVRLDHARRLIEGTRMPIVDVAMACGFMSASHFAKCFRLLNGTSPQQCRATVLNRMGSGLV
ncbi:GlxA family transcriptional regulator [Mesorhizobium sp.]|uniref:GlxA family transcriptional regulator n=1 Tax=Mesorhizobium sp. TaxID=1871066 RepID=UPI0025DB1F93|nr:GlxA family transcriptional regulator [Mesorhizobium sp.]